jgi:hypothetical protein
VLIAHIDRCVYGILLNLRRGNFPRWQSQSQSAYDHGGEIVMATVRIEEYVQTMYRQAPAVG